MAINWKAIQTLSKARPGATPPLLGAANANPVVMAQLGNISQQEEKGPGCMFMAKNALNGGELSPYLAARIDQPKWLTGCRRLRNLAALPQGGITRRPGFRAVAAAAGDVAASRAVFIPFVFGQGQERMLELVGTATGSVLNVYDADGVAIRLGALSLPYMMGDLADLSFAQSADVLYLAHQGHRPAKIMRYSDLDWRFAYLEFLPEIAAPSILLARAVGDIPSGEKSRTHYDYVVTAIDAERGEESLASSSARVDKAAPLSQTYYIELRIAPQDNVSEYRVYKKGGGVFGYVGRVDAASELAPAEKIGNAQIAACYIFEDRNIAADTEDTPPNARDPFSEEGVGNPAIVFLHQQRLGFAASAGRPMTIWLSQSGNYESMSASIPPKDDDAIEVTMGATQVNRIIWCMPDRNGLAVGTQGGEWVLEGAEGVALAPDNLMFTAQTSHGSQWGLAALMTGSGIIYAQSGGRVVRQFSYSFSSDRYESRELTLLARHILDGPNRQITGWAWQGEPYGIVWCVLADGTLAGLTFLPEQEVTAWHRHDTAGQFENIATIRGSDGTDRVWCHVIRNGARHIEIMRPFRRESDTADSADYVDGAGNAPIACECVPYLPETNLQNGSTWMRVRKLNAIKAEIVCSRPFMASIGNAPALPVPVRGGGFATRGQWALPIAGGWREDADLVLTFPGNGPATVLGLLATLELAELSGNQK